MTASLLTILGETAVIPEHPAEMGVGDGVLATEGPHRHTRVAHERIGPRARVYRVAATLAGAEEIDALRAALLETRGGADALLWRHPTDDADATLYRVVNADEAGIEIGRSAGGQWARVELVLERV